MDAGVRGGFPQKIFVCPEAAKDRLTQRVLSALPGVPVEHLAHPGDPLSQRGTQAPGDVAAGISAGKQSLMLSRYPGRWLKRCPGTPGHVCCNLWVVNPGEGCPFDCTYCALQHYLRGNPTLKVFTNYETMLTEIAYRTEAETRRFFRICSGELSDSLALDSLTGLSLELVPLFARLPNAVLELKTKSDCISNLLQMKNEHHGKTIVSWSVNSDQIVAQDEALTASLDLRLQAAAETADAGYRIGFHFDPLVYYPGWQEGYLDVIRRLFTAVTPRQVAWISIAPLRYHPEQQQLMRERFPQSKLPLGEHFLAKDDKLRIFQPLRFRMLRFVWNELKKVDKALPVYLCMESPAAWRSITGGRPAASCCAAEIFSRNGGLSASC